MDHDRFSDGKSIRAIAATNIASATTTYGDWIDTQFFNSIVAGIDVDWTAGAISEVSWQESDASGHGDAADISDADDLYYPTQFPIGADAVIRTGCVSKQRWVRLKIVSTGSANIDVFAMAELGHALTKPQQVESSVLETSDINAPGDTSDSIVTPPTRLT